MHSTLCVECWKSLLFASSPFVKTRRDSSPPRRARAGVWRDCYKLLFSLPPFAFRAPEKLTLNEVMFAATIKKCNAGRSKYNVYFRNLLSSPGVTGIKAKCQLCYTNPRAGKSVWLLCHNVKRHQRPSALQKCAAGREGGGREEAREGPARSRRRGAAAAGVSSKSHPSGCEFTGGKT